MPGWDGTGMDWGPGKKGEFQRLMVGFCILGEVLVSGRFGRALEYGFGNGSFPGSYKILYIGRGGMCGWMIWLRLLYLARIGRCAHHGIYITLHHQTAAFMLSFTT
jgi:hypothetical protein